LVGFTEEVCKEKEKNYNIPWSAKILHASERPLSKVLASWFCKKAIVILTVHIYGTQHDSIHVYTVE
jgi:hypothetical protein